VGDAKCISYFVVAILSENGKGFFGSENNEKYLLKTSGLWYDIPIKYLFMATGGLIYEKNIVCNIRVCTVRENRRTGGRMWSSSEGIQ
jgi:hypothetical protein